MGFTLKQRSLGSRGHRFDSGNIHSTGQRWSDHSLEGGGEYTVPALDPPAAERKTRSNSVVGPTEGKVTA